jgi:hypothetical protein
MAFGDERNARDAMRRELVDEDIDERDATGGRSAAQRTLGVCR